MTVDDDEYWAAVEKVGYRTGHVVVACPSCHQRQLVSYSPPSSPWPRCRVCLGDGWNKRLGTWRTPRMILMSDISKVTNKRPGKGLTPAALRRLLGDPGE